MPGHVIRIFDKQRVVIDLGEHDGVVRGTEFDLYSPPTTITGLDDENLGEYRLLKATVRAVEVHERFTVASPPSRRERIAENTRSGQDPFSLFRPARYRSVPGELAVDRQNVEPLETGSLVAVGDLAVARVPPPEPSPPAARSQLHPGETSGDPS